MPDISKINALAIGSVGKVDGLAKASILDIDGVAVPSAFTGLLDTYTGAAAAYSVRKLKTGVTVAARIRRSGDDIEADVEFDSNNEISLTSPISNASSGTYTDLADFVDHSTTPRDAFCVEWKDQSGNGNDATQPTAGGSGLQPKVYDATTGLVTENGKPALSFDGSDDFLSVPFSQTTFKFMHDGSSATLEAVARFGNSSNPDAAHTLFDCGGLLSADKGTAVMYDDRSSVSRNNQMSVTLSAGVAGDANRPVLIQTDNAITPNQQTLVYVQLDADNATADNRAKYAISGGTLTGGNTNTATPTTDSANRDMHLGRYSVSNALQLLGTMQEIVFWNADHSGSRTGIETDINTYFSIP